MILKMDYAEYLLYIDNNIDAIKFRNAELRTETSVINAKIEQNRDFMDKLREIKGIVEEWGVK